MGSRYARVLVVLLLVSAGCSSRERSAGATRRPVVATFTGTADAAAGTVTIRATSGFASLVEVPVAHDGVPGSGPPDTVELVTESASTVPAGCGAVDGFEGAIRLRSFYGGAVLTNVHAEIFSLSPIGREACNSAPPYDVLSDAFGLWDYGTIGRAGVPSDSAVRTWRFRVPDQTRFTFQGRIMADLVTADPNPPTTVATPGAGSYAGGRVELVCADAETGCAATYYTTDGTEPTAASAVYTGPIPLTSSFTLRFFSVDHWGNAEAIRSAAYQVDVAPPSVVAVTPAAGALGVSTATTVAVTFSEAVDPASVNGATFTLTGPAGAVAGTIAADPGDARYTFTPDAALQAEARYVVEVTAGVHDLAGNALSPSFTSDFFTPSARQTLQPAVSASVRNHRLVYDGSGNALAAWSAVTQGGTAIVFATYSASAGTWSPAQVLQTERRDGAFAYPVRVASNGSQFLVVWCTKSAVRAALIENGVAGAISDLTASGASLTSADLAASASGASFLVVRSFLQNVSGWRWNGSTWSAETAIGTGKAPVLAGSALYYLDGDGTSVMASTYGTAWGTPVAVAATGTGQGSPVALSVAVGSGTVLAYATSVGHVWAAVGSGTSFGTRYDLSGATSETSAPLAVSAAATGSEYAVAWVTAGGVARGSFRNGGLWPGTPSVLVTSGAAELALSGYPSGFVAAVAAYDAGTSTASLLASPSAGGSGSRTWASATAVESSAAVAAEPGVAATGTSVMIHWTQADAVAHQVLLRAYAAGGLGEPQAPFVPAAVAGSPTGVRLAANAAGDTLAVWTQDDGGSTSVYASLHHAGAWSAPSRVMARASSPDVASNGTGFLVVGVAASATTPSTNTIVAVPVAGGAAGPAEVLATGAVGSPRVASDGAGYAALWLRGGAVQAAIRTDGGWLATVSLGSGYYPSLAGRSGEYLFVWGDTVGQYLCQRRASGTGADWSWGSTAWAGVYPSQLGVVAGEDGFLVAYRGSNGVRAWKVTGGVTGSTVPLGAGQAPCDESIRLAASGSRYLVAWNCSDWLQSAETDGTTASTAVIHASGAAGYEKTALGFAVAGSGGGRFRLLYSRVPSQFTAANVYVRDSAAATWGALSSGDDRPEPTQSSVALQWDGGAYVAAWNQTTAGSPIVDDLVTYWAF